MSPLIDTHVSLSRWPFRRCPLDETPLLVAKLRAHGVTRAWAGSFDALLHKDIGAANVRLADQCRQHGDGLLIPFGAVNPRLPDWEEDLRRCHEDFKMPGIRLHPNYHGYRLDDPLFMRLAERAADRGMIVQIAVIMEDERTQHPLVSVEPVDTAPLAALISSQPNLKVMLLNCFRNLRGEPLLRLAATGRVWFEISMLEGVGGIGTLAGQMPVKQILFGSNAPLFYFEAAWLKLQESPLNPVSLDAIRSLNARALLAPA